MINALIFVAFLYLLRDVLAHWLHKLTGRDVDQCRRIVGRTGKGITLVLCFFVTATLYKTGILGAFGKGFGVIFDSVWELLCMIPQFLSWLVS